MEMLNVFTIIFYGPETKLTFQVNDQFVIYMCVNEMLDLELDNK